LLHKYDFDVTFGILVIRTETEQYKDTMTYYVRALVITLVSLATT